MSQRTTSFAVYILTNTTHRVLYVGVTRDLLARMLRHRAGAGSAFCRRYRVRKLVYVEYCEEARGAITREKQLKAGSRADKLALVRGANPGWEDLAVSVLGLAPLA